MQNVTETLIDLKANKITGGLEYILSSRMENRNQKSYLNNIELIQQEISRFQPWEIGKIQNNIIDSLTKYLKVRMEGENVGKILIWHRFICNTFMGFPNSVEEIRCQHCTSYSNIFRNLIAYNISVKFPLFSQGSL